MSKLSGRATAEAIGTFALIYFGCGAVLARPLTSGSSTGLIGIALAHAIVLGVMITCTMNVSGGHINPAVTLGLWSIGKVDGRTAGAYVSAQLAGGVLGALFLKLTLPASLATGTLGTPALATNVSFISAIGLEAVFTFFLMFAVMGTAVAPQAPKVGGFAIGLVLYFDIMVGGTLTGAAMNPARAFGPALVSATWYAQPVWWIGPILGAVLAAQAWQRVVAKG
ncbi:MAG TPA: aquaporin [Gemmatimonadales bacterium]|jgi:aquaporin Z